MIVNTLIKHAIAAALTCITLSSHSYAADKITFARSSPWGPADNPIAFGEQLGFFEDEGIEVDYVTAQGSLAAVQQILGGSADVGYLSPEVIAASYQAGKTPIPMILVYNYYRKSVWELVVLDVSPVKSLADLKGKSIGVGALTSGNVSVTTAALAAVGLGKADYELLPVGFGAQAFQALTSGEVAALNLFHTVHETLANTVNIRRVAFPAEMANVPSSSIAFSTKFVEEHPDLVGKFGRALTKSTVACAANREACTRALWAFRPETKPAAGEAAALPGAMRINDVNLEHIMLPATAPSDTYGSFEEGEIVNLFNAMQVGGYLADANVPTDKVFTNAFVKQFNDFDRSKVEDVAKAAK
jgi:NitT/TauT family transport system substrate-binding protein